MNNVLYLEDYQTNEEIMMIEERFDRNEYQSKRGDLEDYPDCHEEEPSSVGRHDEIP